MPRNWFIHILILLLLPWELIAGNGELFDWRPADIGDAPRVAVVLSGGGAHGFAHIGMLRVLEEYGIPIDMIVGTSMGALVGGFYAAGYSPGELEEISFSVNWTEMFTEPDSFLTYLSGPVIDDRKMLISFNFDTVGIGKTLGIIPDQEIVATLSRLLFNVSHIRDFNDLTIPYRAVAVDLLSGEERVFDSGRLMQAIRASIAIPGVFSPYEVGGRYYVDGGVRNNLPVNAAVAMGADIIIAVSVDATGPDSISEFSSAADVLIRSAEIVMQQEEEVQASLADVTLSIDVTEFEQTEFWRAEELVATGYAAGQAYERLLRELADWLSQWRTPEIRDAERTGGCSLDEVVVFDDIEVFSFLDNDSSDVFPVALFRRLQGVSLNSETLRQLDMRIDQLYSSGAYESIGYGLEGSTEGYALELLPVHTKRGRHSLNAGFMFNGSYGASTDSAGWNVSPGFVTSLKFTHLFNRQSYLHVNLELEDALVSTMRFFYPFANGIFLAPHLQVGERRYLDEAAQPDLSNIVSFFNFGMNVGYLINDHLEVGSDLHLSFQWMRSGQPGDELPVVSEMVPLLTPMISWKNCPPSRFVHEGIRTTASLAIPVTESNQWYHKVVVDHQHFIPLSLNATLFYDIFYGSYRGTITAPWTCFDIGGWDGIPGYLPEFLACSDALMAGIGYQQRLAEVSEALNMDTYLIGQFRAGNGYTVFPGWDQNAIRFGASFGIGIDTIIGEMIIGAGVNQDLRMGYYVLFN